MADDHLPGSPHALADLNIENVSKTFQARGKTVQALARVTLRVPRGAFVALIGPSGCGKSTLLRLAAGLEKADEGSVRVRNGEAHAFGAGGELGIAFQDPALLPWRSVRRNVALPLQVLGRPVSERKQR